MAQKNMLLLYKTFKATCPGFLFPSVIIFWSSSWYLGISFNILEADTKRLSCLINQEIWQSNFQVECLTIFSNNVKFADVFVISFFVSHLFLLSSVTSLALFLFYPRKLQYVVRPECIIFVFMYVNAQLDFRQKEELKCSKRRNKYKFHQMSF